MCEREDQWRRNLREARRQKGFSAAQQLSPDDLPLLSVMIPTIPSRAAYLVEIVAKLDRQIKESGQHVELLAMLDNRSMTIGEKRNHLTAMARGMFHIWTDDDNDVAADYIAEITKAIVLHPDVDVITFKSTREKPGQKPRVRDCRLGNTKVTMRKTVPCHINAWNARLAKQVKFPHINMRDDWPWTVKINSLARTEHHIDKVLYHYRIGYGGGWG